MDRERTRSEPNGDRRRLASRDVDSGAYWDSVIEEPIDGGGLVWRQFCDRLHERLLNRWFVVAQHRRVLKTDLFDEVCGRGLVRPLATVAETVHGIDISPGIATRATAKDRGVRACVGDVRAFPYRSGAFDVVFSNSTLDHFTGVEGIRTSLGELRRILAPGGLLAITLDNPVNPVIGLRAVLPHVLLRRLFLVPYYVGTTLSRSRLCRELEASGFEVVEERALMHVPRVLAILLSRLLDRAGLVRGSEFMARCFESFEVLGLLPTRYLTGYYVAVLARRRRGEVR